MEEPRTDADRVSLPSSMLISLVIGIFAAATVTLAVAVFSRAPTRVRCPECGGATKIVLLPPVLRRNQFVHLRWCPGCQWEGLGRNGPDWIPGHRLAHHSGFHWGEGRFEPDFGFRFRWTEPTAGPPPHHPSGFRFTGHAEADPGPAHHPSGFRFSPAPRSPVGPPIFRWAEERRGQGFSFKGPGSHPREGRSDGFNWKGVA